jgi:hypothetical protein
VLGQTVSQRREREETGVFLAAGEGLLSSS